MQWILDRLYHELDQTLDLIDSWHNHISSVEGSWPYLQNIEILESRVERLLSDLIDEIDIKFGRFTHSAPPIPTFEATNLDDIEF